MASIRSAMRSATLVAIAPPAAPKPAIFARRRLTNPALVYEIIQQGENPIKT
jgi:hypothetical protein